MRNKEIFKETMKEIGIVWLRVFIYLFISIIFFKFILDELLEDYLANTLYSISPELYYTCVANKNTIFMIYIIVMISIALYIFFSKRIRNEYKLYESLESVLDESGTKIELPPEMVKYSEKLNTINYEYVLSKNKAKEAEQKKNDLIMYMAHDLKTPLTSVIGYLTLLKEAKIPDKEFQEKYINIAYDKSLRLEELINQFFEITRYNLKDMPINKTNIDISLLFDQLIEEFYPMLEERNLKLEINKPNNITFYADGDKMARALGNLLKNAISYSYENSTIVVNITDSENTLEITFKNKGVTIPKYKLDKLFEQFYRADESRRTNNGGAGLGLAITKDIIELHGGTIFANSENEVIEFVIKLMK